MTPSFSSKNGVRYRFYVSSAILRGRKAEAGSLGRIPAAEIESAVLAALGANENDSGSKNESNPIERIERVVASRDQLRIKIAAGKADSDAPEIRIARSDAKQAAIAFQVDGDSQGAPNESLIQSVVRAHTWVRCLQNKTYASVEALAEANRLHPKVVRQALRLVFLSPEITAAILEGTQSAGISLSQIPKLLPLSWREHRHLLG